MKNAITYIAKIFSDKNGNPSAKRYACALFGITAVVLTACGFGVK